MKAICQNCFFCQPCEVIDTRAKVKYGQRKPRVPGYSCHITKPSWHGFPEVKADDFCGFFTDPQTKEQPFAQFVRANTGNVFLTVQKSGEGSNCR